MKLFYIGWLLGMTLGWVQMVAETPDILSLSWTNGRPSLEFRLLPSVSEYRVRGSNPLGTPGSTVAGKHLGTVWTAEAAAAGDSGFYRLEAVPLAADTVRASTLLNRIAYGPTPDELDRLATLGTDAYIEEQLAPERIAENLDEATGSGPVWRKITITGTGSSSKLYVYLSGAGDAYLDDFRLVSGASDTGNAPNLLLNGDFEQPLATANWTTTTNTANSARTTDFVHGGNAAFHLVQAAAGSTATDAVVQTIPTALNASTNYTLSFWYLAQPSSLQLTVRLSGSGIAITVPLQGDAESPVPYYARLQNGTATIADLRAWHVLHAVQSRRQLAEVFQQFVENHFVTEYSKGLTYFDDRAGLPNAWSGPESTRQEFKENLRWRQAFLNPQCTFHDLLKISAESPAMIIYLDTVLSRGDYDTTTKTNRIANENYARELCELFAFGVDNGYEQGDIEQISRAWTGWTVELRAHQRHGTQQRHKSRRSLVLPLPDGPPRYPGQVGLLRTGCQRKHPHQLTQNASCPVWFSVGRSVVRTEAQQRLHHQRHPRRLSNCAAHGRPTLHPRIPLGEALPPAGARQFLPWLRLHRCRDLARRIARPRLHAGLGKPSKGWPQGSDARCAASHPQERPLPHPKHGGGQGEDTVGVCDLDAAGVPGREA